MRIAQGGKVNLKPLGQVDINQVLDIERETFGDYAWDAEMFRAFDNLPSREILVGFLTKDSSPCCYLGLYRSQRTVEIITIVVEDLCRNQGIGTELVSRVEVSMLHTRRRVAHAIISETNELGCEFFKSLGYQSRIVHVEDVMSDEDDVTDSIEFYKNIHTEPHNRIGRYYQDDLKNFRV